MKPSLSSLQSRPVTSSSSSSSSVLSRHRLVWLSLAQMLLACTNILATTVMMINFNFQSQYNWSLYSGPWVGNSYLYMAYNPHPHQVLLSSFFLLYYWWYSDHSSYRPTIEKNLATRQKLQVSFTIYLYYSYHYFDTIFVFQLFCILGLNVMKRNAILKLEKPYSCHHLKIYQLTRSNQDFSFSLLSDNFHYNLIESEHLDLPLLHVFLHHAGDPVDEVPVSVGLL